MANKYIVCIGMDRKYAFFGRFNTEEQTIRRKKAAKKASGVIHAVKLRAQRSRSFINRSLSRSQSNSKILGSIKNSPYLTQYLM